MNRWTASEVAEYAPYGEVWTNAQISANAQVHGPDHYQPTGSTLSAIRQEQLIDDTLDNMLNGTSEGTVAAAKKLATSGLWFKYDEVAFERWRDHPRAVRCRFYYRVRDRMSYLVRFTQAAQTETNDLIPVSQNQLEAVWAARAARDESYPE